MKKTRIKIVSVMLAAALAFTGTCPTAFALNDNKESSKAEEKQESRLEETATPVLNANTGAETAKDETVYVIAGSDGSVNKVIVSDLLKNGRGDSTIVDKSELTDIENVKGYETFAAGSDGMLTWNAKGNDICYNGNTEKALPLDLAISYKLDGKAISAGEIAGKSGKVTIRFDYKNNQYEMVRIDGKEEKIYVPFVVLTGAILDGAIFKNVEVENGKAINDGDRTVVVGYAMPGLQDSLGIDREKIEIPAYVEITADAAEFELGMTVTVATNEIFSGIDKDKPDSIGDLTDSLGDLTDAMNKLLDGASKLSDGLETLYEKTKELGEGVDKLASGAEELQNGTSAFKNGASQISGGISNLCGGLDTLSSNSGDLRNGAKQVFESLLKTAEEQIKASGLDVPSLAIDNYAEVLNRLIGSLDENAVYNQALNEVTAAVEAKRAEIEQAVTAAVKAQVEEQVMAAVSEQVSEGVKAAVRDKVAAKVKEGVRDKVAEQVIPAATSGTMTKESYEQAVAAGLVDSSTQQMIEGAIDAQMETDEVKAQIDKSVEDTIASDDVQAQISAEVKKQIESAEIKAQIDAATLKKMGDGEIKNTIASNTEAQIEKLISENMSGAEVQGKLAAASAGAKKIIALKASLDGYNSFYIGLRDYTAGVQTAAEGASSLKSGALTLKDKAAELDSGAEALRDGVILLKTNMPTLTDGIKQLRDGASELTDGLRKFKEEGIEKLVNELGDNLDQVISRLKATIDVSENYNNFSGITGNMKGSVKFIYRTDEISMK